jgi:membrane-associated phospholipid phosphatase
MSAPATAKRWTVSSGAGRAAGVPLALFVALAANAWRLPKPKDIDRRIADSIAVDGTTTWFHWADRLSRIASPIGGIVVMVATALYVWRRRHDVVAALGILVATTSAGLLQLAAKPIVRRPRPTLTKTLSGSFGFGFPSGHAAGYGALGSMVILLILAERFPAKRQKLTIAIVVVLTAILSMVRVFIGAHYFTDALGGLALGCGMACVVVGFMPAADHFVARRRERRNGGSAPKRPSS